MRYLLDTHVWLWSVGPTDKINQAGLDVPSDGKAEVYFSAASAWEVAIKTQLGKFTLSEPPGTYVPKRLSQQGIHSLSISQGHTLKVYELPEHHRDPFDRLLIAQGIVEQMTILTADRAFGKYDVEILWCGK